jgi:hypothetical protein
MKGSTMMKCKLSTEMMITLFNQSIGRLCLTKTRNLIHALLLVGVLVTLVSAPVQGAEASSRHLGGPPADTFSILLEGPYRPVVHAPNLGLFTVDLSDGSYSKTKIFPVSGLPIEASGHGNGPGDHDRDTKKPIGTFYVQFAGSLVAYDLPGGAISMAFTSIDLKPVPDGQGGTYLIGTADLDITEATGVYESFVGGHNKMVDILHQLADGTFVEHCICIISRPIV